MDNRNSNTREDQKEDTESNGARPSRPLDQGLEAAAGPRPAEDVLLEFSRQMVTELHKKEQLAQAGLRAAEFAHDMRNPLHIATGYLFLVSEQIQNLSGMSDQLGRKLSDYFHVIESSVKRCREIAEALLTYARGKAFLREPVCLSVLAKELVVSLQPWAQYKRVVLRVAEDPMDIHVYGVRVHLLRALQNVLVNAVESYRGRAGEVRVRLGREEGMAVLEIADEGGGVSREVRVKAFDSFFSEGKAQGIGLGLSIARQIAQEHDGFIELLSDASKGTTVIIRMPLFLVGPPATN